MIQTTNQLNSTFRLLIAPKRKKYWIWSLQEALKSSTKKREKHSSKNTPNHKNKSSLFSQRSLSNTKENNLAIISPRNNQRRLRKESRNRRRKELLSKTIDRGKRWSKFKGNNKSLVMITDSKMIETGRRRLTPRTGHKKMNKRVLIRKKRR